MVTMLEQLDPGLEADKEDKTSRLPSATPIGPG